MSHPPGDESERFWSKVDRSGGPDACWPFIGSLTRGYGQFYFRGRPAKAHRVALILSGVEVGHGHVLHFCDNPPCCNPKHLHVGTHAENMREMSLRGRAWLHPGLVPWGQKLTEEKVVALRYLIASGETVRFSASVFGIEESHAAKIARGEKWTRAGGPRTRKYPQRKAAQ